MIDGVWFVGLVGDFYDDFIIEVIVDPDIAASDLSGQKRTFDNGFAVPPEGIVIFW